MIKKASYVGIITISVAILAVLSLKYRLPTGPIVLGLTVLPVLGLFFSGRSFLSATPDLIFGVIDTGLLTVPALWGGVVFGVAGAVAGGVVGDALTDSVAGFFEGSIAQWLRARGIEESREPITTALGKMSGCLLGSGIVLSLAWFVGIEPKFG
jgi:hypothetical protein